MACSATKQGEGSMEEKSSLQHRTGRPMVAAGNFGTAEKQIRGRGVYRVEQKRGSLVQGTNLTSCMSSN